MVFNCIQPTNSTEDNGRPLFREHRNIHFVHRKDCTFIFTMFAFVIVR